MIEVKVDDKICEYIADANVYFTVEVAEKIYFDGEDWLCGGLPLFSSGPEPGRVNDRAFTEWLKKHYPEVFI